MTQEETPDDIVEEDGDQPNDQGAESVQNLSSIWFDIFTLISL